MTQVQKAFQSIFKSKTKKKKKFLLYFSVVIELSIVPWQLREKVLEEVCSA
jgi:hypothetical protein